MTTILLAGTVIVNLALVSYSMAIFRQRKTKSLGKRVMFFLTLGVILDITATVCMVMGSSTKGMSLHGLIGYSSLLGMLIDTFFSYKNIFSSGFGVSVSDRFTRNSSISYFYWVLAYITGATLVMLR